MISQIFIVLFIVIIVVMICYMLFKPTSQTTLQDTSQEISQNTPQNDSKETFLSIHGPASVDGMGAITAESIYRPLHGGTPGGLYIIDMANRELYLYIDDSGYMGKTLTVAYCNTIADNTYTFAKNKQYFRCADETFNQMYIILDGGRIAQPMKHFSLFI